MKVYGIEIDLSRDGLITDFGMSLLKEHYLLPTESSPQEAYARAAVAYCAGDLQFAQRIYDYVSKNWLMFSTPVLSNAPAPGEPWQGLPISCYLTYVDDNLHSLISHSSELRWLSVKGGGVGGHWSDIRAVSKKSPGPIPFLKTVDADMTAYHQKGSRRGSYAAYLDISHPDIVEFLNIRVPTGGDENRKCFNLHNAINITDEFMHCVQNDSLFNLIDPHNNEVKEQINARQLWHKILETRARTGEPYLHFIDTANKALPQTLKDQGLKIRGSNLCIEIELPTDNNYTAVCCLSSLVAEHYDDWKDTLIVQDAIRLLDNVIDIFISHAPVELSSAIKAAINERSLGLGLMGFHSYLQKNGIPWESAIASIVNHNMSSHIQQEAIKSTKQLALERGEYPGGIGTGRRNAHLLAIAPNANTSIIANTSPSIEPNKSNAYTHRTRVGSWLVKNKHLEALLISKGYSSSKLDEIWNSIILSNGSVQHLQELDEHEKHIYKTAFELNQEWVVQHAADRQHYICQGQSVNLFFPANVDRAYVNKVHLKAWKSGVKGLYYYRTSSTVQADKVANKIQRVALKDYMAKDEDECMACHA
jgi:ribonucleoside-diphosphate reductase alpha chain